MVDFLMDAHMHFDLYKKREDILTYIESQCSYTIAVTNLPELYERYYQKYGNYKYVKIALGFHPELVYQYKNQLPLFLKYVKTTKYIGEVGLDYSISDKNNRAVQREVFTQIVNMGSNKILSVHSRRAEAECNEILKLYTGKVIMHWYSGGMKTLRNAIEMGCYFSINHQMLKSKNGKVITDSIPIERILIESDAPFSRGLNNEYSLFFNDEVYKYLSKTRNLPESEVALIIKNNFKTILS